MSTKVAAPTATRTCVRRPPPRWRYCRSAPISVPRMKAASRLTIESRKSGSVNEWRNAIGSLRVLERKPIFAAAAERISSFRCNTRELDDFGPFLGFAGNEFCEILGRARRQIEPHIGETGFDRGI